MEYPRMTTRRWMSVIFALSIALWLGATAIHVINDRQGQRLEHLWERHHSPEPGSVYNSGHPAPFWPRYWRRVFGQPWPGTYTSDPSVETESRYGRLVVTIAAPLLGDTPVPVGNLIPKSHPAIQLISEYNDKYLPRHWKKDADGLWFHVP
jgi:hypothetical protein